MVDPSELLAIPAFADLPADQIAWVIGQSEEMRLQSGDILFNQGDPAEWMLVILEGEIQGRGDVGGETIMLSIGAGQVTGKLPFSRMRQSTVSTRAVRETRLLRFPAAKFQALVQTMPELTSRLVGLMSDRIREFTRQEQQRDRLAALGKLSAGLAHELNNPASAATRATSQLRDILKRIRDASHDLGSRELTGAQKLEIEKLETSLTHLNEPPPDPLTRSALEDQLDSLLRSHGQNDLWQLSAGLARRNVQPEIFETLFANLDADTARATLGSIAASVDAARPLH